MKKKKKKEEAKTLTTKRETKANIKESKCREMSVNKRRDYKQTRRASRGVLSNRN
jgi:hypothetical protein